MLPLVTKTKEISAEQIIITDSGNIYEYRKSWDWVKLLKENNILKFRKEEMGNMDISQIFLDFWTTEAGVFSVLARYRWILSAFVRGLRKEEEGDEKIIRDVLAGLFFLKREFFFNYFISFSFWIDYDSIKFNKFLQFCYENREIKDSILKKGDYPLFLKSFSKTSIEKDLNQEKKTKLKKNILKLIFEEEQTWRIKQFESNFFVENAENGQFFFLNNDLNLTEEEIKQKTIPEYKIFSTENDPWNVNNRFLIVVSSGVYGGQDSLLIKHLKKIILFFFKKTTLLVLQPPKLFLDYNGRKSVPPSKMNSSVRQLRWYNSVGFWNFSTVFNFLFDADFSDLGHLTHQVYGPYSEVRDAFKIKQKSEKEVERKRDFTESERNSFVLNNFSLEEQKNIIRGFQEIFLVDEINELSLYKKNEFLKKYLLEINHWQEKRAEEYVVSVIKKIEEEKNIPSENIFILGDGYDGGSIALNVALYSKYTKLGGVVSLGGFLNDFFLPDTQKRFYKNFCKKKKKKIETKFHLISSSTSHIWQDKNVVVFPVLAIQVLAKIMENAKLDVSAIDSEKLNIWDWDLIIDFLCKNFLLKEEIQRKKQISETSFFKKTVPVSVFVVLGFFCFWIICKLKKTKK